MSQFSSDMKAIAGFARKHAPLALVVLTWLAGASAAMAQETEQAGAAVGDPMLGKSVAERCVECHGPKGLSETPDVPHLAGQHAGYLLTALNAYRSGLRGGEDMQLIADLVSELTPEDMANVAAYYGGLAPFTDNVAPGSEAAEAAREAAAWDPLAEGRSIAEACAGCHGERGNDALPGMPGLAGQPKGYLLAAMAAYKDGSRKHDEMQVFVEMLEPSDLEAVARYYTSSTPTRAESAGAGDPFAGRAAAAACSGCHGEDGNAGDSATPRLAGLDEAYLAEALRAYKQGARSHAIMQEQMAPLDEADIVNVSAFYAAAEPKALAVGRPVTVLDWVRRCGRCHGEDGYSSDPRFPILAGQSKAYLVKALKLYHGGERDSSMMYAMSFPMGGPEIEHLAAYYAGQTAK
jgi:cytochrome c553